MSEFEMMIDLETLDTKNSAVVLSIGAVVWGTLQHEDGTLTWEPINNFLRVLNIDDQIAKGRTVSEETLCWWMDQSPEAKAEAFRKTRTPSTEVLEEFMYFGQTYVQCHGVNSFWAKPSTFDFSIWDDLADDFMMPVPWKHNQKYDVRSVVKEVGYSVAGHDYSHIHGVPHRPVYDCECQIDLLTAARVKMGRRLGKK